MEQRPDIIFIMSDDQGAWAMNCAGTRELYTPNLDRLAGCGTRFDQFFCVSPVCSPARASLLTGTIPSYHGVHDWIRTGNLDGEKFKAQGLENPYLGGYPEETKPISYLEGQTTYTDLLAASGYHCALSGKWHLGDSITPQHGFEKWYTIGRGGCYYNHPDMVENGDIRIAHGQYVTELITDKALDYLKELEQEEAPFYLSVHYTAPHSPWEPKQHPARWIHYYKDCNFASIPDVPDHPHLIGGPVYGTKAREINLTGYFAAISAMDKQIGRILMHLRQRSIKRERDTLIIFTSDNGMSMGHHGIWGKGNGTFPFNMYDTAIKVPFIAAWQSALKNMPGASVCSEMVSAYDIFPTLLEIAHIPCPENCHRPGRSFADILTGSRHHTLSETGNQSASAKEETDSAHDDKAIVIYDEYGPTRSIRTDQWKYIHRYPNGSHELYHLTDDPQEEHNLYGQNTYDEQILMLREKMQSWFWTYARPETDGRTGGVTGAGQMGLAGKGAMLREV